MANYYTYGLVPDVDETVYGTSVDYAGLGFPEYADRGLPEEAPVGPSPLSLIEDEGMLPQAPPETVERYASYLPKETPAVTPPPLATPNPIPPGLEAAFLRMRGQSPEQLAAKAQATAQTKPQREVLSNLLQTGQFDKAFKYAKDEGVQNLLIDPTELKTLRGPFSNDEMKSFFAAMPKDLMGEQDERAVKFTPDKALDQSLQVASIPREGIAQGPLGDIIGYPDVQRAFEPQQLVKEPNAFDKLIKAAVYAGLAYAGTTALAASGSVGKAIVQLPETLGLKVGEALGANTLSSLQAKMIGNAVISGGVTGAKGGDLEDVLKSAAIAAGFTYVSDKAIKTIAEGLQKTGVTDAVQSIPGGDVTAVDPSVAADVASNVKQGLEQFTVSFSPVSAAAQMASTVGALSAAQAATPSAEKQVAPEDEIAAEYTQTYERPLGGFGADLETGAYTGYKLASDKGVGAEPEQEIKVTTEADKVKAEDVAAPLSSVVATKTVEDVGTDAEPEIKVTTEADKIAAEDVAAPLSSVVATEAVKPEGAFDAAPTVDGMQEISQVYEPTEISGIYANLPALSQQLVDYKKPLIGDQITPDQLEEIVVRSTKPAELDIFANVPGLISNADAILSRFPSQVPAEFYTEPEVVVQGTAAPRGDLTVGIPALSSQFEKPLYKKPGLADTPLEEIVVETKRPTQLELITPPFDLAGPESPPDLTKGALEEVVVEGKKPTDTELVAPPFTIPLKTPVEGIKEPEINQPSKLKALLDEYGTLENYLKLLGALGSAFSGTKGATTPTAGTGTGGLGGALPKYTYTRQQLSPDIDYYTYGTRPEAKFFEQGLQLEKPTQPEGPPAKPPGDEPVMAEGGLMGYAKGGSKESRYVDGPGSGRDDKIPALLSDGEYVIDAETLALLGDGSTKEGARRMDKFRANIRKHKGRALSRGQISPDAKSPDKYMGGGLA